MPKKLTAIQTYMLISAVYPFFLAIWQLYTGLYRVSAGLTPLQLVLAGTALELSVFLAEVPTGIVADLVSRRLSVIIGFIIMGLGFFIEGLFPVASVIIATQAVWGLGFTFISGAQDAWLADEIGTENLTEAFLRGSQIGRIASISGTFIAAGLALFSVGLPLRVGGLGVIFLGLLLVFVMPENNFRPTAAGDVQGAGQQIWHTFEQGWRIVQRSPILRIIFVLTLLFGLASEGLDRFWEAYLLRNFTFPDLLAFSNLELGQIGLFGDTESLTVAYGPHVALWFFLLNISMKLIGLIATEIVRRRGLAEKDVSTIHLLIWINSAMILGLALFISASGLPWALAATYIVLIPRGLTHPIRSAWINRQIKAGEQRATVLSMWGQTDALGQIISGPLMGLIATLSSIRVALAGVLLLWTPALWLYRVALKRSARD